MTTQKDSAADRICTKCGHDETDFYHGKCRFNLSGQPCNCPCSFSEAAASKGVPEWKSIWVSQAYWNEPDNHRQLLVDDIECVRVSVDEAAVRRIVDHLAEFDNDDSQTCGDCESWYCEHWRAKAVEIITTELRGKKKRTFVIGDPQAWRGDKVVRGETQSVADVEGSQESSISSTLAEIKERWRNLRYLAPESTTADVLALLSIIDSLKAERDALQKVTNDRIMEVFQSPEHTVYLSQYLAEYSACKGRFEATLNKAVSNMKAAILQRVREHLEKYRPDQYILTQQGSKAVPLHLAIDDLATELEAIELGDNQ